MESQQAERRDGGANVRKGGIGAQYSRALGAANAQSDWLAARVVIARSGDREGGGGGRCVGGVWALPKGREGAIGIVAACFFQ